MDANMCVWVFLLHINTEVKQRTVKDPLLKNVSQRCNLCVFPISNHLDITNPYLS